MPNPGILRTSEERFSNLPDFDYDPQYMEIAGFRIAYIDEGPREGAPVLLLHGEPSWSFLYRKMIPPIANAGFRVIVPDLLGFGRSDKPTNSKDFTYQKHVDIMTQLVRDLYLKNITLFCQDWGGLIGLRVLGEEPEKFARVIAANTFLPAMRGIKARIGYPLFKLQVRLTGKVSEEELLNDTTFMNWVAYTKTTDTLPVGQIIQMATTEELSLDVVRAYDAPFPDEDYKLGAKLFPYLVPSQLSENQRVWDEVLSKWTKPFLTTFSDGDPITRGRETYFQKKIPGAHGQNHRTIKDAGHFLQEDKGGELAEITVRFIEETR